MLLRQLLINSEVEEQKTKKTLNSKEKCIKSFFIVNFFITPQPIFMTCNLNIKSAESTEKFAEQK